MPLDKYGLPSTNDKEARNTRSNAIRRYNIAVQAENKKIELANELRFYREKGNITKAQLKKLEYLAVSRIRGSLPRPPDGLPETDVTVDLHTRKRMDRMSEWDQFFVELGQSLSSGSCGIMIHHNRMNTAAFGFLGSLLQNISRSKGIQPVHLKDLVRGRVNM